MARVRDYGVLSFVILALQRVLIECDFDTK